MDKQDMIRRMSGFVRDTMKESGETERRSLLQGSRWQHSWEKRTRTR